MCKKEHRPSILVIDDNPENLRLFNKILNTRGYKVRLAANGELALATIKKEAPDLIVLDIMMPGMGGFEVCGKLQEDEETSGIPIIFISALDATNDKVRAFSLGGVDYISKPFQEEEVLSRIETHLTLNRLRRQLERKNEELQKALNEIKTLRGILPICACCKKIRVAEGAWQQIEVYIRDHTEAEFSHGLCEECTEELYPGLLSREKVLRY